MNNNEKYLALRSRYPQFEYVGYHHEVQADGLRLWFDFRMGDVEFHPEALVERRPFLQFDTVDIDRMVFEIGMIELISYWKCACAPKVVVRCGSLSPQQVDFWRKLYWHGLGEFFYTNSITATSHDFMSLQAEGSNPLAVATTVQADGVGHKGDADAYIVPIGGGKDSVVTLELLRQAGKAVRPLIMNPRGATIECARVAGFAMSEVLVVRRSIDPRLLDLNAQGYLNGHTPFSAMLAFYARLVSALSGVHNVALSNESSANESTVIGTSVNHQYSKSLEFEDDFRSYTGVEVNYFSFLRPLSELQIAMLFSRCTQYHDVFRSCNVGSKQDVWCGHCAKCLFAYIILSPFISPERLDAIFGKSMLDDISLRHEMLQLAGLDDTKPFECVGTVGEVRQALAMTARRWYPQTRPALMQEIDKCIDLEAETHHIDLSTLLPLGNLSPEERNLLQQACIANSK